jgi:hypothetical protein
MKLVAISRVKNEADIIEPFIRHHAHTFDVHVVLDDGSSDGTWEMLQELEREGLSLVLIRQPSVGYRQRQYMTGLMRLAAGRLDADWVVPLDADEFLETSGGINLAELLRDREPRVFTIPWNNFVWSPEQDEHRQPNPVLRMRLRMPASPAPHNKVLIPTRWPLEQLELTQGSHAVLHNGQPLPADALDGVRLCHFPVRTKSQFAGKIAIGYLQYATMPDWNRRDGFHYIESYRLLKEAPEQFYQSLPAQSRRYGLYPTDPDSGRPTDDPLRYLGGDLVHGVERRSELSTVLEQAEALATRLAEVSQQFEALQRASMEAGGAAQDSLSLPAAADSAAEFTIRDVPLPPRITDPAARASVSAVTPATFQSFWAGGPLSPYELLCLNSFVKCGHAFDLYAFDTNLAVPAGVQLRDARELFGPQEFFVYEDGFGKGSPAGFANIFRYKLLAEKGGWWVDTDVVCQARNVPVFKEFFARQDDDFVNNAVLFFEPGHPLMVRCLEEAAGLGRAVRWGDSGPRLLTRILQEQARHGDALDSSVCYPVHYSEALDVLVPSRLASTRERAASSLFIHLWNAMLDHHGIDKTMLPPKGSALRRWAEQNSMEAWAGEYDAATIEALWLAHAERRRLEAEREAGLSRGAPASGQSEPFAD